MIWQMACTGRKWCDFVSYDPTLPEDMQLFIKRFERNEDDIAGIEQAVKTFLEEVAEQENALRVKYERKDNE